MLNITIPHELTQSIHITAGIAIEPAPQNVTNITAPTGHGTLYNHLREATIAARIPGARKLINVAIGVSATLLFLFAYKLIVGQGHPYLIGLFPVVLIAIFFEAITAVISLTLTAIFILAFEAHSQTIWSRGIYTLVFILESSVAIWVIASRKRTRIQLARTLEQRNHELDQLQKAHDKLAHETSQNHQSVEELRNSNRIMLETLERIIGKTNRDR